MIYCATSDVFRVAILWAFCPSGFRPFVNLAFSLLIPPILLLRRVEMGAPYRFGWLALGVGLTSVGVAIGIGIYYGLGLVAYASKKLVYNIRLIPHEERGR